MPFTLIFIIPYTSTLLLFGILLLIFLFCKVVRILKPGRIRKSIVTSPFLPRASIRVLFVALMGLSVCLSDHICLGFGKLNFAIISGIRCRRKLHNMAVAALPFRHVHPICIVRNV